MPVYDDLGNPGRFFLTHREPVPGGLASGANDALVLAPPTPRWALPSNDYIGIAELARMLQSVQARVLHLDGLSSLSAGRARLPSSNRLWVYSVQLLAFLMTGRGRGLD